MRISIRHGDAGHLAHAHARSIGKRASVKLNGQPQFYCITADSDCGMVVRYVHPFVVDRDRACMVDEVVHGKVEIEFNDEMVL